jgi:hypothetical protein
VQPGTSSLVSLSITLSEEDLTEIVWLYSIRAKVSFCVSYRGQLGQPVRLGTLERAHTTGGQMDQAIKSTAADVRCATNLTELPGPNDGVANW